MKVNWFYIKLFALLILVGFLYGFSSNRNKIKKVKIAIAKFEKQDNLFINEKIVDKLLIQKRGGLQNQAKSVIDLHELENGILAHPMVENATVFLTINGTLKTHVKQRTPIARVQISSGGFYIDRLGEKMPLSSNYSARVPLVTGLITKADWKKIHFLIHAINDDVFMKKQIIGVHKNKSNEFELKTRIGNQTVLIGEIESLKTKFKKLQMFYNKTFKDNSIDKYSFINLKYTNQVVCKKK